jgi:hypothetical protein
MKNLDKVEQNAVFATMMQATLRQDSFGANIIIGSTLLFQLQHS